MTSRGKPVNIRAAIAALRRLFLEHERLGQQDLFGIENLRSKTDNILAWRNFSSGEHGIIARVPKANPASDFQGLVAACINELQELRAPNTQRRAA